MNLLATAASAGRPAPAANMLPSPRAHGGAFASGDDAADGAGGSTPGGADDDRASRDDGRAGGHRAGPLSADADPAGSDPSSHEAATAAAVRACLDAQALRALIAGVWPGCVEGRELLLQVHITQVRRNTSRRRNPFALTLQLELDLRDLGGSARRTQALYGKLPRAGSEPPAPALAPMLVLPAVGLQLWAWPADPSLPQLPALAAPMAAAAWWPDGQPSAAVERVKHEPEDRATLRHLRRRSSEDHRPAALYAKTFADHRGEQVMRRVAHFWNAAQADTRRPTVPEPLGYDPVTRTLWQAAAHGVPIREVLEFDAITQPGPLHPTAQRAALPMRLAMALAALHEAPASLAGGPARDTAHWLAEVQRRARKLARAEPSLAPLAARALQAVSAAAAGLPSRPPSLIHGDCHPDQFWLDGTRIVMFDFDEFTLGDPMEDLAQFVTRLSDIDADPQMGAWIVGDYAAVAAERFDHRRLRWHLAVQQMLQASRAFVFQRPDWAEHARRRLGVAADLAEAARKEQLP